MASLSPQKKPNLDSVTTINPDGSRFFLHPADVRGAFTRLRSIVAYLLLAVYVLLPWIQINGAPAVFLDVASRRFHILGLTFAPQDVWLLFFVITGLAFGLFYVTALFGRIWCGWTCPYTVFLEFLYRRVERLIDGSAPARRRLDSSPWSLGKIGKRVLKHFLFVLISAALAHVFLSYFVTLPDLYEMMQASPLENAKSFGIIVFFTLCLYFAFSWFREQFCIIMCPYGRIQSALTDQHTMVIGYDASRGEPRGKATDPNAGACVGCNRCVQVCPTGIDIREGLQIECIGCAACVDACNDVMSKLDRPEGLIRYDSEAGLAGGRTQWIRPRTVFYTGMLAIGVVVMGVSLLQITPLKAGVIRMPGAPYYITEDAIRNQFQVRVINKTMADTNFRMRIDGAPDGARLLGADGVQSLAPMGEQLFTALIEIPRKFYGGKFDMRFVLEDADGATIATAGAKFIGPNPELLQSDLNTDQP